MGNNYWIMLQKYKTASTKVVHKTAEAPDEFMATQLLIKLLNKNLQLMRTEEILSK